MMQIQINIKDAVKFLAQSQDPQDSVIQVTETRSFIPVKTMSVTLNIANAITTDFSILTLTLQVSTSQGHRGVRKLSPAVTKSRVRNSSKHEKHREQYCLCQLLLNFGLSGSWVSISQLCRKTLV